MKTMNALMTWMEKLVKSVESFLTNVLAEINQDPVPTFDTETKKVKQPSGSVEKRRSETFAMKKPGVKPGTKKKKAGGKKK